MRDMHILHVIYHPPVAGLVLNLEVSKPLRPIDHGTYRTQNA